MPVQAPPWTDFLCCLICYNEFECNVRRPISLGCGHTACKSCLSKLQRKQCPFDQTVINTDINQLPENYALLQLVGGRVPEKPPVISLVPKQDYKHYLEAKKCIEELALYLKSPTPGIANGILQNSPLSRPMQRKLVTLINCQLVEEEGRARGMRAARSLGERSVTELILQHQNPQQLSANLWAAVRARGCQFLGPAMQEEVLKLVLLALEDGSALSRKVLVMFVVQRLAPHFPQASKTSIGHVVQLLYRASCFKVSKREGDSSLMQLKDEFRTYEALRREHDAQIVQIATEAGLRIAPEQWSSLLYGDTAHKSHMQSIIDKLQTPQSFSQSVQELVIALQRTGDPGNLSVLRPHLELLAAIDPSPDAPAPPWEDLKNAQEAAKIVVKGLVDFVQNFGSRKVPEERVNVHAKYKTSMCRDLTQKRNCPRGLNCTFAHSDDELSRFRARNKRNMARDNAYEERMAAEKAAAALKDDVIACNSSPLSLNSHSNSNAALSSPDCGISGYTYEGSFLGETPSCETEAISENSPSTHLCSVPVGNRSLSDPSSHLDAHSSIQTSHMLNPESPAFQPLTKKSPQVLPVQPSYQTVSTTILSVIPTAIAGIPAANLNLSSNCLSQPSVQSSPCLSTCDTSFSSSISCLPSVCHMNAVQSKDFDPSIQSKSAVKNQLECQTLAALQQRKKHLLAQLDKVRLSNASGPDPTINGNILPTDVATSYCILKTMDDGNTVSYYSPWTSANVFPYGSSTHCTNSDYSNSLNSSCSEANSIASTEDVENGLLEMDFSNCALFCPSEKDEFIPFDPPLVSKYGPISRCSKSLIRGPAPIQVNAVSHMGELTSPTSAVRHPLPSASLAPSFYATNASGFTVPVAIIPEQYLPVVKSASVVVPVAVDCSVCLPNEAELLRISNAELTEGFKPTEECIDGNLYQMEVQAEELNTQLLKEELWEVEKTIEEKEMNILKDGARYSEHPYKQKYDLKIGGTVPTSIGPWPSQTLENIPFKPSEIPPIDPRTAFKG
ncbi:roquin-1-like [Argiope bruennichi]|uniref:RING-type E3 ubiquitin transferase n=1 Tax=Argiope bruennichi TaxID=94029 RepID=A0A8T0F5T0_ARGBR|nr:roquin-1-like [Argiope bruennichi]KAF8785625.1 Roquin-2 like protein [Argiope bruennichi]